MEPQVFSTESKWNDAHTPTSASVGQTHMHRQSYPGDGGVYLVSYKQMWCDEPGKVRDTCCVACCPASPGRLSDYALGIVG